MNPPNDAAKDQNLVTLGNTSCKAFKLDEGKIKVEGESLSDGDMEMPRINYGFNGVKYRYFYAVGFDLNNFKFHSIHKVNNDRLGLYINLYKLDMHTNRRSNN